MHVDLEAQSTTADPPTILRNLKLQGEVFQMAPKLYVDPMSPDSVLYPHRPQPANCCGMLVRVADLEHCTQVFFDSVLINSCQRVDTRVWT